MGLGTHATIRPRFWIFISLLLLNQLIAPALSSRRWEQLDRNKADKRTLIDLEQRINNSSNNQEFTNLVYTRTSTGIDESSGLLIGTCAVRGTCTVADDDAVSGYSWASIGKGLLKLLEIGGLITSGVCLSLSVVGMVNCGGLSHYTCQKYREVKRGIAELKTTANDTMNVNEQLRLWNYSNAEIMYTMQSVQDKIEMIVVQNADLINALGHLNYNSTPTDISVDERDKNITDLHQKLVIEAKIDEYIKDVEDRITGLTEATNIFFAVFAGVSFMIQFGYEFVHGIHQLHNVLLKRNLMIQIESPTSGIAVAMNPRTGNKYFVKASHGVVDDVLGRVRKEGGSIGGFFDMFASPKTKAKVDKIMKAEKIKISQGRVKNANIKCSGRNKKILADWTKDMRESDFRKFVKNVKSAKGGSDKFISNVENKPNVKVEPPSQGGIMSQQTAKFKPAGKFSSKVTGAIKSFKAGLAKSKVWNGMKKYGFKAMGAILGATSIALCIKQVVETAQGTIAMNKKLEEAAQNITMDQERVMKAHNGIVNMTGLHRELFANLTRDTTNMLKFFANDTTESEDNESLKKFKENVAKVTPRFRGLLERVQNIGSNHDSQLHLHQILIDFKALLKDIETSLRHCVRKVKKSLQIRSFVKMHLPVKIMKRNLIENGYTVNGTFEIVNDIARDNQELDEYDSYPLNCLRKGTIKNQLQLDDFMKASGTVIVSEQVQTIIMMAVYLQSSVEGGDHSIVRLLKVQNWKCSDRDCTAVDVLGVIAKKRPDMKRYDGYNLDDYRNGKKTC